MSLQKQKLIENGNEVEKVVGVRNYAGINNFIYRRLYTRTSKVLLRRKTPQNRCVSAYYIESSKSLINSFGKIKTLIAPIFYKRNDSEGDTNHLGPYRSDVTYIQT